MSLGSEIHINKAPSPTAKKLKRQKQRLFFIINGLIILIVGFSMFTNKHANFNDALYIITLGLICTLPVAFTDSYRGTQSLMLLFLAYYFGIFGLKDIANFIANDPISIYEVDKLLSTGEIAILIGAICFIAGYLVITILTPDRKKGMYTREWSHKHMTIIGFCVWFIGIYIEGTLRFGVLDFMANVTATSATGFIILLRYLEPLGALILIYLAIMSRSKPVITLLIIIVLVDFMLGFLSDSKELAVRTPILYLFSYVLLRENVPLIKTIIFIIAAGLMFNIFASYRISLQLEQQTRTEAYENIGSKIKEISDEDKATSERLSDGLNYFADRITLKNYVERLMVRVGKDIDFLHGKTIEPIIYAFVPRFILPDKPATNQLGQLFNRTFKISGSPDTFIALSQLGEFYWNYGWTGIVLGMMAIGAFMSWLASRLRLDTLQTLPRFLLLLMTVYLLTLRFETTVAQSYTLWARFAILFLILNYFIPKEKQQPHQNKRDDNLSQIPSITGNRIISYKKH